MYPGSFEGIEAKDCRIDGLPEPSSKLSLLSFALITYLLELPHV